VAFSFLNAALTINPRPVKAVRNINALLRLRKQIHENAGEIKAVKTGSRYYWSANVPGWPSEAFNEFVRNEFIKMSSPEKSSLQTVIFGITSRCPLKCVHCYEWENISERESLTYNELSKIMVKLKQQNIRHIQFSGGEPLARFDDMISLMKEYGDKSDFWINTSGYGLTREKAEIMKQSGMTGAIISLDHWDEIRHNAFRNNEKSFQWVAEAAKNCAEAGLVVSLSLCPVKDFITKENLEKYTEYAKSIGAGFIRILEPRPVGRFSGKDVRLSDSQIKLIDDMVILYNNNRKYRNYPIFQFPGHHQRKQGCLGAGNRYIYIDPQGNFHACPFCRKPLGSAVEESIEACVRRAKEAGCHLFKPVVLS
jgi:MoaA/NifB/PqqE/SkfB family radical SAM enzyme